MHTVNQILSRKGAHAISIPLHATVIDTLKLMAEKNIGSVIVLDEAQNYCGIVTERD